MEEERENQLWPLPKFHFSVDLGGIKGVAFQEVSGLEVEAQVIEYRAGDSKQFSPLKMPGIVKAANVTLKRGVFINDSKLQGWLAQIRMNTIKRSPVVIRLLDEGGHSTIVWTLQNAWPTKITGTDLKADGNEVVVETIEIAHEGLTVTTS